MPPFRLPKDHAFCPLCLKLIDIPHWAALLTRDRACYGGFGKYIGTYCHGSIKDYSTSPVLYARIHRELCKNLYKKDDPVPPLTPPDATDLNDPTDPLHAV